jgi:phosphate transport system permease protein
MNVRLADRLATTALWLSGMMVIVILLWFLIYIFSKGLPYLNLHFVFSPPSVISFGGGVGPELFNSFYILFLSLLFSLPIGLGAGIYLAEYAKKTFWTDMVRLSTEALSSVPSIVFGLFGMILFVDMFRLGFSILGGAFTLALLNLPVLVRVTEESFRLLPASYREASLALGATRWQMIRKVLLPSALPGLMTGIILVAGRAFGESAILIYTAGVTTSRRMFDFNVFKPGETLAVHLWYVHAEGTVPDAMSIQAGSAALLIVAVLLFNLAIGIPARMYYRKFAGGRR